MINLFDQLFALKYQLKDVICNKSIQTMEAEKTQWRIIYICAFNVQKNPQLQPTNIGLFQKHW